MNLSKKNVLIHYMVNKKENTEVDTKLVISCIYTYAQNKPIYFEYEPTFYNDVLVFGIIGIKREHLKLQKVLGSDLIKLNCKLNILEGKYK